MPPIPLKNSSTFRRRGPGDACVEDAISGGSLVTDCSEMIFLEVIDVFDGEKQAVQQGGEV